MAKKARRSTKQRRAVRPPVIDLKAEEAEEPKPADAKPDEAEAAEAAAKDEAPAEDAAPAKTPDDEAQADDKPESDDGGEVSPEAAAAAGGSRGKLIAGGLALLLLIGILLGGWLYRDFGARLFGAPQGESLAAIEERLGALEAAAKANAGKLDTLTEQVASAEQKLAALEAASSGAAAVSPEDLAAVEKSVADVRAALTAASGEDSAAGQAANKAEIDKLSGVVAAIGERIGKAETAIGNVKPVDTSGLESKLTALEAELGGLKAQQDQLATQTRSELGEAFARLSGKVAGSGPFMNELDALVAEAPAAPGIDKLRGLASSGVASLGDLAKELEDMKAPGADDAAETGAEADGGLMGALKTKLSSVVKIRKLDEADWPVVLPQAASMVRAGQLAQAIELLKAQPGEAPEALAEWHNKAVARAQVEQAMTVLSKEVLGRRAATGTSG